MRFIVKTDAQLLDCLSRIREALDGKPWQITLKRFKRDRTLDQNAKAHAMIRDLALHTGYTESQMKDIVKTEFAPVKSVMIGSRICNMPMGTSEMNVSEMAEFIEHLYQLGAEIGCGFYDEDT